eukprot:scaffold24022_cov168-Amphora_coffeaeformis.AAC.13
MEEQKVLSKVENVLRDKGTNLWQYFDDAKLQKLSERIWGKDSWSQNMYPRVSDLNAFISEIKPLDMISGRGNKFTWHTGNWLF